jgi:hypothetical protein
VAAARETAEGGPQGEMPWEGANQHDSAEDAQWADQGEGADCFVAGGRHGVHPELTGREPEGWEARRTSNRRLAQRVQRRREGANQNIFLNGAILGMRKAEIARKFDEIVEFSGCARYIDTPVTQAAWQLLGRLPQAA